MLSQNIVFSKKMVSQSGQMFLLISLLYYLLRENENFLELYPYKQLIHVRHGEMELLCLIDFKELINKCSKDRAFELRYLCTFESSPMAPIELNT